MSSDDHDDMSDVETAYLPGEMLEPDQEVRLEIVKKLMEKGTRAASIENEAEKIVKYILDGPEEKPAPPASIKKRLPVFLPSQDPSVSNQSEVTAYIREDGTINLEEWRHGDLETLWELIDEDRLVALSFTYHPARPVDTSKDS